MAEKVGEIYYDVTLETGDLIRQQRKVDNELRNTSKSLDGIEARLTQVAKAVSAYAAALYLVGQADAFTKINAQLRLATDNTRDLASAQEQVRKIAQEAQTDIGGVATLYARISQSSDALRANQAKVAEITRVVALALKVSGAGAQESASATLQLSQAFAAGALRGEEFNSVSEAAPRLMQALADGIGVPRGQLRAMAEEGKLTADILSTALPKALEQLEQEAGSIQTIGGAFQQLKNEMLLFIGEQATASGAATVTAAAISTLATNIDTLAAAAMGYAAARLASILLEGAAAAANTIQTVLAHVAALQAQRVAAIAAAQAQVQKAEADLASLAATKAGILVAREQYVEELKLMQAFRARGLEMSKMGAVTTELAILGRQQAAVTAQQTAATAALSAAQGRLATATTAAGTASRLASSAIGLLGGPIGAVTTALGLCVTAWMLWGDASEEHEARASEAVDRSTEEIVADLDKQISKLKERNALAAAGMPEVAKQETDAAKRLATLQRQIDDLQAGKGINGGGPLPEVSRVALIQDLMRQYGELYGKVQQVNEEQDKLAAAGTSSKLTQWMTKYASDAERITAEIAKAKKELGAAFTPELEQRIRQKIDPPKKAQKTASEKFDSEGYLAGLRRAQASEIAAINETETEKLRINDKRLKAKEINEREHAAAILEITAAAEKARADLLAKTQADIDREREASDRKAEQQRQERDRARMSAREAATGGDPIEKVRLEEEAKLAEQELAFQKSLISFQMFEDAKVGIKKAAADRIAEIEEDLRTKEVRAQSVMLQNYGNLFGSVADLTKTFAGEQSGIYKAMFAVSKAFAIADSIVKIQNALATASTQPFPANLGAMATVAASTAGIISTISSTNFGGGRQYGGPVSAGTMYRVNETGKPEMFTAANGNQYMLPTQSGQVTAADKVGGARSVNIVQHITVAPGATYADVVRACNASKEETKREILYSMNSGGAFRQ